MVALLSQTGMSTRAIAPVVEASKMTVQCDVIAGGSSEPPDEPVEIAGRDGKTYTRPEPKPERDDQPRRRRRPGTGDGMSPPRTSSSDGPHTAGTGGDASTRRAGDRVPRAASTSGVSDS